MRKSITLQTRWRGTWAESSLFYQAKIVSLFYALLARAYPSTGQARQYYHLRDLLETHAESEAGVSLGDPVRRITTLEQRLSLGEEWYREHARTELLIPATLDGLLLLAFVVFGVYLWTL